jgi:hypothetical protein
VCPVRTLESFIIILHHINEVHLQLSVYHKTMPPSGSTKKAPTTMNHNRGSSAPNLNNKSARCAPVNNSNQKSQGVAKNKPAMGVKHAATRDATSGRFYKAAMAMNQHATLPESRINNKPFPESAAYPSNAPGSHCF